MQANLARTGKARHTVPRPDRIGFTTRRRIQAVPCCATSLNPVSVNAARQAPPALHTVGALFKRSARSLPLLLAGCTRTLRGASGISPAAKGFGPGGERGCVPCGRVPVAARSNPLVEPHTASQRLLNFPSGEFKPEPGCEAARSCDDLPKALLNIELRL